MTGSHEVHVDAIGNVWGQMRDGDGPVVILCAHLDTVFGSDVAHTVRTEGDRLFGPSVGDDSVGARVVVGRRLGAARPEGCRCGCSRPWGRRASATCAA